MCAGSRSGAPREFPIQKIPDVFPGDYRSARAEGGWRGASAAGFSLIEVLIVLVLIGLATVMAVPRIDLDFYRIDAGMHAIGSQLLGAQRLAIKRQHNVVVAFDTAGHRFRIHQDADNDGTIDAGEINVYTALGDGIVFGGSGAPLQPLLGVERPISFAGRQNGMPAVTFRRSGSASEEGGFALTSKRAAAQGDKPTSSRAVRVERSTGRITWYRYSGGWKRES
jgi:prepilin-type N-terminal cleavage/methylation domain-containing protein